MHSLVIFILASLASASVISPISYYLGKRSRSDIDKYRSDFENLKKSATSQIESHKDMALKYKEIAESHTITWQGFESKDIYEVVLDKTYTNHPEDILKFVEQDLLKFICEDLHVDMEINTNGQWTTHLNSDGWGSTDSKGVRTPMKSGQWVELSPCTSEFNGSPQQIIAGITNALKCGYFFKNKKWLCDANLQMVLKVKKNVRREPPKPKVEFVEVKVAIPQYVDFDQVIKRIDDEIVIKRANEIAAELEIDKDLRNAVNQKLKSVEV